MTGPQVECDIRLDPGQSDWSLPPGGSAARYEEWLHRPDQLALLQRIPDLVGKRLGCTCGSDQCHGNVLVRYTEALNTDEWKPPSRIPQPHIALVNAWWFSIPYQFRPDTKGIDPSYTRYTRTAKRLLDAGYTADEIARFVREAYANTFWPGKFMELEFVEKNIKAWKSGGNRNNERSTARQPQNRQSWPPTKPGGRPRPDAKRSRIPPAIQWQEDRNREITRELRNRTPPPFPGRATASGEV